MAELISDVIIIGSGAAGGLAAHVLTSEGINVVMLDAGEKFNRSKFWTRVKPWKGRERLARGHAPVPLLQSLRPGLRRRPLLQFIGLPDLNRQ